MGWANAYSQGTRLKRRFGRRAPVGSPVLGALTKAGAGASTTGRNIEEKICVVPEATFSSRKGSFITRKPHGGALPTWLASGCVWVLPIQQGVATSGRPDNRGVLTGPVADGSPPPVESPEGARCRNSPTGGPNDVTLGRPCRRGAANWDTSYSTGLWRVLAPGAIENVGCQCLPLPTGRGWSLVAGR